MNKVLKWVCTGMVTGALLLTGTTGLISKTEVVSAATAKPLTVDQMMGKLTAASKTLKSYHLNSTKKQNLQLGDMRFSNINTLDVDINRQPKFAAIGTFKLEFLDTTFDFDLYANDNEFYYLVDGSTLLDEEYGYEEYEVEDTGEPIDPDGLYWITMEKEEWDILYSKGQFDPASVLDSVKNYKKSMKVTDVGSQSILQFTVTEPKAAKAMIDLYDRDLVRDAETVQPKSVTWKLYVNKKTFQTEKLTVDMSYVLVESGEKETITTKVEAKYSSHNKIATVVKPAEIE